MSYENYVPNIESQKIIKERDKLLVYANNCTREWEGEITKAGDSVTIFVEGDVPVYVLESDGTYTANGADLNGNVMKGVAAGLGKNIVQDGIPNADTMQSGEIVLQVKKIAVFNVKVGDIDQKLASKKDLMGMNRRAIARKLAEEEDKAVAKTIFKFEPSNATKVSLKDGTKLYGSTGAYKLSRKDTDATSNILNVLDFEDRILQYFREINVGDNEEIICECSPKFERVVKAALVHTDTDNSTLIKGKKCYNYSNIIHQMTNLCYDGAVEKITFRLKRAVAFFDPFMHIEPYRAEKGFSDCLKGFQIFDCGIVLPKEVLWFAPVYEG